MRGLPGNAQRQPETREHPDGRFAHFGWIAGNLLEEADRPFAIGELVAGPAGRDRLLGFEIDDQRLLVMSRERAFTPRLAKGSAGFKIALERQVSTGAPLPANGPSG